MAGTITWTGERFEKLLRLCAEGKSYRQIGREMGVSRSSVAGVIGRRKIAKDPAPQPARAKQIKAEPDMSHFLGISFMGLTDGDCRFPVTIHDQTFFCGRPQKEGSSYCPQCHSFCYRMPDSQSRKQSPFVPFRGYAA